MTSNERILLWLLTCSIALALLPSSLTAVTQVGASSGIATGTLRGPSGLPLEGVRIAVKPVDEALLLENIALTDPLGRYRLEGIAAGRYHVVVGRVASPLYHPGVLDVRRATTIAIVSGRVTEVPEMVLQTARVSGRVIDAVTGQPRRAASVTLCCDRAASSGNLAGTLPLMLKSSTLISASVNERGEFTFFAVPPGNYSLQVSDPQIVSTVQLLSVGSPEGIPDLELRVSAGVQVRGRIEETLGRPVENVQVRLKPDESSDVIELTEEPPGARQLSFSSTATTSAAMLRFYSVTDVRRSIVAAIQPRIVPVAADGTFGLRRIVPGRYTLQVFVGGLNSFSREIEVGAGDNERRVSLPFTLVAGRILNEDGSRLPSLSGLVRMVPSDPNAPMLFGFPDDAGRFSVLMPPGQYRVFTDTLNVGRNVLSVSDGVKDLRSDAFFLDGTRSAEIRITLKN